MSADHFSFLVSSSADLPHCGLALAASRAGAIGVLDFEHVRGAGLARARANRERFRAGLRPGMRAGIRVNARQLEEALATPPEWIVVLALAPAGEQIAQARRLGARRLMIEVADREACQQLHAAGIAAEGIIACAFESGGWSSPTGAFVLTQRLADAPYPLFVKGASGPRALAACRIAGASGAVLSDELLLMSDSPLPETWRAIAARLDVRDTAFLGERLGAPLRVASHGAFQRGRELLELVAALEKRGDCEQEWRDAVAARVGWGDPAECVWPIGQGIGFAAKYAAKYRTTGTLLCEWQQEIASILADAAELVPFGSGSSLAQSHRTEYPVIQGAMTRVSDNAAFARAVADGGGLPMIALALLQGSALNTLIDETASSLAGRSWGAGILGFVPLEIREEQIAAILRTRPPFALIAGGRPDQAAQLEAAGIATYLHVPSPSLVAPFLEAGAKRFIFEGSESGGHVGPLGAFALWESSADALLESVPKGREQDVHVIFAGGIHDARSAAMASAFAAPLARRGIRTGVLMGTAYLFTKEAVESGAIVPRFQQQALACTRTVTLESGTGHANRCAVTPFTSEFQERRRALLQGGVTAQAMKDDLDRLGLGRLRLATKGKVREQEQIVEVDDATQQRDGMYMIGEVATLRDRVTTIRELHHAVCEDSRELLAPWRRTPRASTSHVPKPSDVAIVGIAMQIPGAEDPESFWDNMIHARCAIGEIPADRWDWRVLFDPEKKPGDRSYSKWGGFIRDVVFDPLRYGIPPNSVKKIGVAQLLALELVGRAMADAGYDKRSFDRDRVAVVMAEVDHGGMLHQQHIMRTLLPFLFGGEPPRELMDRLNEWNEDSFPGSLSNITAGRVSNRFDFGGPNFAIDSACASSLTALDLAVQELESGRSDMAVIGGIDTGQHPYGYVAFSNTQALSPTGQSRPFDKRADGIVIAEGLVVVVLKRLADAERDGDRIYAVVKAVAGSSDGKAMGLTAPRPAGQLRALHRAYGRAGIKPAEIGYYEAHGTGTAVGDAAEAQTIVGLLKNEGAAPKSCALGSAKALVGHTKTAAGLVGVAKAALALRHGVFPPHRIEQPLDAIADEASPVFAVNEARPWLANPDGTPRRAGVSAFGFGGTNSHAVLEEYRGTAEPVAAGAERWPAELFVFGAGSREDLLLQTQHLAKELRNGATPRLRDLAMTCATRAGRAGEWSAAIVATSLEQLVEKLDAVQPVQGLVDGKVALLFPGQSSQYAGMGRDAALYFHEFRERLEHADVLLGERLSAILDPVDGDPSRLIDTANAQPAIGVTSCGFAAILERLGVQASMTAGHSYGEYVALHHAGALSYADLLRLSVVRGRVMRGDGRDMGVMVAAHASADKLAPHLVDGVVIANRNTPSQTVLSGDRNAMARLVAQLDRADIRTTPLQTSGAFHSPLMAGAFEPLAKAIAETPFAESRLAVYRNAEKLEEHLLHPVDFIEIVERMYADGARVFVESGPSNVLTSFVSQILGDRPHVAVSLDRRGGRLADHLAAIGELWIAGHAPQVDALFTGRGCALLDLANLAATTAPPPIPEHAFYVNGLWTRAKHETATNFGRSPLRDVNTPSIRMKEEGARVPMTREPEQPSAMSAYEAYQQTMRQFLKTQEEVLRMFLGASPAAGMPVPMPAQPPVATVAARPEPQPVLAAAPVVATPLPVAPAPPPASAPTSSTREDAERSLIASIAEVTGYPTSMIDRDADLEADLGVDSIRRLEVFQKFRKTMSPELSAIAEQRAEKLARGRSVTKILDGLFAEVASRTAAPVLRVPDAAPAPAPECPRFVMRAIPRALNGTAQPLTGTFAITGAASPVAAEVVAGLRARGANAVVLTDETNPEQQLAEIANLTGVIHLASLVAQTMPSDYGDWRTRTQADTKALFRILNFTTSRGIALRWIAAASAFGGSFGRDGAVHAVTPSSGAAVGLLKTYEIEQPGAVVKALDFDVARPAAEIARQLLDELQHADDEAEVGFANGERAIFTAVPAALAPAVHDDSRNNWVFLVTGGARGITARVVKAMAAKGQTMIIVGRARLAGEEDPSLHGMETVDSLRKHLIEKATRSGVAVKPVQIDAELSELLRDREIRYNLDALRAAGVDVRYEALDVRSPDSFKELLDDTYRRYGRIDAVIHGAGVIADKLLAEKSTDVFDLVFDTKVDSTYLLYRHLRPESLRLMLLFASTAGRFGNRGQSDYAAANEVLNRFAWRMKREWPSVCVKSINWGPWLGSGMASQPVNDMFRARGVEPIDPNAGIDFALRELAAPSDGVEVVAGEGPWRKESAGVATAK